MSVQKKQKPVHEPKQDQNKEHWDELGSCYNQVWLPPARQRISKKELAFIQDNFPNKAKAVLDIGCGNGRILQQLDALAPKAATLYAIDISESMLAVCKKLPLIHKTIFARADIAVDRFPHKVAGGFEMVTSIRVLKYNKDWEKAIASVAQRLAPGGVFVCTMTNKRSLNIFGRCPVPIYRTNIGQIRKLAAELGLEIAEMRGFSRIPDLFYHIPGRLTDWVLAAAETVLGLFFGKRVLQRELFIAFKKPSGKGRGSKR